MKHTLKKIESHYCLFDYEIGIESFLASTNKRDTQTIQKIALLHISQIETLLGKVDVEKLALEKYPRLINDPYNPIEDDNKENRDIWTNGYNQALQDNAKKFTLKDMVTLLAWWNAMGTEYRQKTLFEYAVVKDYVAYKKSQEQTEWECTIEMDYSNCDKDNLLPTPKITNGYLNITKIKTY